MRVLLIDVEGDFPNLALMKLSSYHKNKGDEVRFGSCSEPDVVYISCVFTWNRSRALSASTFYPNADIRFGGSGFNLSTKLAYEVEHSKPDYTLYPHADFSLGFTTRGCIRKCPWCIVPEKEGGLRAHSPLEEFVEPKFGKIVLLDNNLLAYEEHSKILKRLIVLKKKVCFSQGLDIRLVTEENAKLLSRIKYYNQRFKRRQLYFAWDLPETEPAVKQGIQTLLDAGIRASHLMFYVLMCFNTTYKQDLHRLNTLIRLGVKPYVMLYNNIKGTYQVHMKRWIEHRYYKYYSWETFDRGDSQFYIQKERSEG